MSETEYITGKIESVDITDKAFIFVVKGQKYGLFKDNKQGIDGAQWNKGEEVKIGFYKKGIYNNVVSMNGISDAPKENCSEELDNAEKEADKKYNLVGVGVQNSSSNPQMEKDKDIHLQVCFKIASEIAVHELDDSKMTSQNLNSFVEHVGSLAEAIYLEFNRRKTRLMDMRKW
jgi:hypothetical protein